MKYIKYTNAHLVTTIHHLPEINHEQEQPTELQTRELELHPASQHPFLDETTHFLNTKYYKNLHF